MSQKPEIISSKYKEDKNQDGRDMVATAKCPGCGLFAGLDKDQFEGKVSIDCPNCDYHETHDLRK